MVQPFFVHLIDFLLNLSDFLLNVGVALRFFHLTNDFFQVVHLHFGFLVLKLHLFDLFSSGQDLFFEFFLFVGLLFDFSGKIKKDYNTSCISQVPPEAG